MIYTKDVFLSYSSKDVGWAERLENGMEARGIKVYRDKSRLTAGDEWQPQLQNAIETSRHLVVLWSAVARDSDWVEQERIYFEAGRKGATEARKVIFVNLDANNKAQSRYEQINNIRQGGFYAEGPESLDKNPDVRTLTLNRLEEAVKESNSVPIYKILLVSTLTILQNIDLDQKAELAPTYGETLSQLDIKKDATDSYKRELEKYYGESRSSWKPFGSNLPINSVLDDLRTSVQAARNAPQFRWRDVDEDFWSNTPEVLEPALAKISQHLALIIIDPISLYDPGVMTRLKPMRTFLRPEMCATAVVAPFEIPAKNSYIRKVLRGAASDIFHQYAEPVFNGSSLYPLSLCAHDDVDVRRVLCSSLDQKLANRASEATPVFLRHIGQQ